MARPSVRARQLPMNLATLRRMHPNVASQLEHAIHGQLVAIDSTSGVEWIDFEVAVHA